MTANLALLRVRRYIRTEHEHTSTIWGTAMSAAKGKQNARGNKGGGRKTCCKPEYAEQAQKLCATAGFTDQRLAEFFEVSEIE
jgi:hypothetical protein